MKNPVNRPAAESLLTADVKLLILSDALPENERRHVLSTWAPRSLITDEAPDRVVYQGNSEQHLLTLVYVDERPAEIEAGKDLTADDVERLATMLRTLQASRGEQTRTLVFFAPMPTAGSWRYRGVFQILPLLPSAPRPNQFIADHPLLLQVRIQHSDDEVLNQIRTRAAAREIELLLVVLLEPHFHGVSKLTHHWALVMEPDGAISSQFVQAGYWTEGLPPPQDDFDSAVSPCAVVSAEDVYGRLGLSINQDLQIPATLEQGLDQYWSSSLPWRERFLRACYWFQVGIRTWSISRSAHFTALVQAIESLMPSPSSMGTCSGCGKEQGPGPTRRFMEFVEAYAPGLTSGERRMLYSVRSAITHGGRLMFDDTDVAFGGLHTQSAVERRLADTLQRAVRLVLINHVVATPLSMPAMQPTKTFSITKTAPTERTPEP